MAPSNSVVMCNSESQWEALEAEVVEYVSKGRILICGDLNARTGEGKDFIDNDAPVPIDFRLIKNSPMFQRTNILIIKKDSSWICV